MKLGIIGHDILAVQQAFIFDQMGAEVTLFMQQEPLWEERALLQQLSQEKCPPPLINLFHQQVLRAFNVSDKLSELSAQATLEQFVGPLLEKVNSSVKCRHIQVKRVHKRFISRDETIADHSRLFDLFRVIYAQDPSGVLKSQIESNPELFENMPKEVLQSLSSEAEGFEDFDLIIESLSGHYVMGPGGAEAINEKALSRHEAIYYGPLTPEHKSILQDRKKLTVIGSDAQSALNIIALEQWLKNPEHQLSIVTDEVEPFSKLRSQDEWQEVTTKLFAIFDEVEHSWNKQCDEYQLQLQQWRALDPFVRTKEPEPTQPELPIAMYNGYNVTSFDKLIDREGLYLTLECPSFRSTVSQNAQEQLKTIACDAAIGGFKVDDVIKSQGMNISHAGQCIQEKEPGLYFLKNVEDMDKIQQNILSFFSRN